MQRLSEASKIPTVRSRTEIIAFLVMTAALVIAPMVAYPVFLMKALCFALFACAFNLLIGYVGLISFGHALFFGWASYVTAYTAKAWVWPPLPGRSLGLAARARHRRRHRDRCRARCCCRRSRHPPPGHLFRDDHAGVVADDVFLR